MRSVIGRICARALALCSSVVLVATHAHAQAVVGPAAPEIDGSAVTVGLSVLAGAVLILRSSRRSK